jgi:flagellar basal body-associated protein FliL
MTRSAAAQDRTGRGLASPGIMLVLIMVLTVILTVSIAVAVTRRIPIQ